MAHVDPGDALEEMEDQKKRHTCAWCQRPIAPADRSICESCWPADAHGPIGFQVEPTVEHIPGVPQAGEVWGDPHQPETWRLIERVSPNIISYVTFAKGKFWDSQPRKDFDDWFFRVKAHNITGMVEDYLQRGN